jgi:predicted secreted protein
MLQALTRGEVDLNQAQLTQADSGQNRTVALGKPIFVRLSGNPSTGCQWRVAELHGETIRQEGEPTYHPKPERRGTASGGGVYVFKFNTVKPGKASLKLVYAKAGEKGKKPVNLFTATIEVTSAPEASAPSATKTTPTRLAEPRKKPGTSPRSSDR